ncbi:transcription factor bHLH112-like isoform X1 [Lolium rigidum]|uniref:transcription factor bHLH112-like isoform X1 n=1 Tax=Lolium rigidum TaxID=89674 RepID=UPI001F5D0A45|nr:transcription factor bHLH112-like isoform X1 [Lolium rigidum]
MADHGQEMIRAATATPAALYNGAATTSSGLPVTRGGGDHWWRTALAPPVPSCSAPEMPGFNAWSAESPRSNSIAGSSITFQEPAGVPDPATIAADWNQPFLDGSGLSGYMSSRSDQDHGNPPSLMSPSSSNNNSSMMLQLQDHHHDQNYQFLSTLGFELLSSPGASPYGSNSRSPSLLRSLTEPSAAGKPNSPAAAFQRYHAPATCQAAATSINGSNTSFWNPSTGFDSAAYAASLEGPSPAPQSRLAPSLSTKNASEGVGDSTSIPTKKMSTTATTPPLKKKRTETQPSTLPTFKVRKEKLGDRVTALQQLVSPFGKTDTASVLHETIEYIKFLHDQVGAHSAPYLKNRQQVPHSKFQSSSTNGDEAAAEKRDLTGRGLCLVPVSSTFAVASETPVVDFWNPFGAVFR